MDLRRVGYAAGDGTTITIPAGHDVGDLLLIYAFRSATTAPTLPAGWTLLAQSSTGASSFTFGFKIATSAAETSGTWTNATGLICAAFRNPATNKNPCPAGGSVYAQGATATNTTPLYSQVSIPAGSWVIAFAAIKSTTSTIENAPTGLVNQINVVGAAVEYAAFDSNGIYTSNPYPSNTTAGGVSAEWRTFITPIFPNRLNYNNYAFGKVKDGMVGTDIVV